MFYFYNSKKLHVILSADQTLQKIIDSSAPFLLACPYDGMLLGTEDKPTASFLKIVQLACYGTTKKKPRYYRYMLKYKYFVVQWEPIYNNCPQTLIYINPAVNQLTPLQILELIRFIVGEYQRVYVHSCDDKVDNSGYTPKEIVESLYAAYVALPPRNYKDLNQTYYIGAQGGEQIRVYDKAKHLGLDVTLVRIEKKVKYRSGNRPTITEFLLQPRTDAFKRIVLIDLKQLKMSSKLGRLIKAHGTLMKAYHELDKSEREKFKRSTAYRYPSLDLLPVFQKDLHQWLDSSPSLVYKLFLGKIEHSMRRIYSLRRHSAYMRRVDPNELIASMLPLGSFHFIEKAVLSECWSIEHSA